MSRQPSQIVFAVVNAPKIARRSGAKSRNGCLTCKARHIKCTEEKPICRRCAGSGKRCAGYKSPSEDGTVLSRSNSPSSVCNDLPLTVDTVLGLPQRPIDRLYLEHFRSRSSVALSRLGNDTVLQLSVSRPTIQLAILAFSAQHQAYLDGGIGASTSGSAAATYGLHQYSKGIAALNQSLTNTMADFDLLEVMVACALFASFELLQGSGNGAMRHCRGGLQILSSKLNKAAPGELVSVLNSKPVKFLMHLCLDSVCYSGFEDAYPLLSPSYPLLSRRQPPETKSWAPKVGSSIFEHINTAREDLYSHLADNYFFEHNVAYPFQEWRRKIINSSNSQEAFVDTSYQDCGSFQVPDHILHQQEDLLVNMRNWNSCLQDFVQPLMELSTEDETTWIGGSMSKTKFIREYALMHITCVSSYMSIYTCLAADDEAEELYDRLQEEFRHLLRSAEIIVLAKDSPENGMDDCEWADQGGVIQPLAFTALKCRDRILRNRAISLLSMSRKGSWDGQNLAHVVRCVVDYEEKQAREERKTRNLSTQGDFYKKEKDLTIPACARVYWTELEVDMANRKASIWMKCARDEAGTSCKVDLVNKQEEEDEEDEENNEETNMC